MFIYLIIMFKWLVLYVVIEFCDMVDFEYLFVIIWFFFKFVFEKVSYYLNILLLK